MRIIWEIYHWRWFIAVCLDFVHRHMWWNILRSLLSECCRICHQEIVIIWICLITESRDVNFILRIHSSSENQLCFVISRNRIERSVWLQMSRRRMKVLIDFSIFFRKSSNLDMKNVNNLAIYVIILFRIWFLQQISEREFKLERSSAVFRRICRTVLC